MLDVLWKEETVRHIFNQCNKLAQREDKRRHDDLARHISQINQNNWYSNSRLYEGKWKGVIKKREVLIV